MDIESTSRRLTRKEFEEIQNLVGYATSAVNKKAAEPYIGRLSFMRQTLCGKIPPNANNILGELICSVKSASGQVKDKAHWMYFVSQDLYKLESYGVEKENHPAE